MSEQAPGAVNDDDDVSAALGQRLIASGALTPAGFERARRSPDHGLSFGAVLTSLGLASEHDVAKGLSDVLGLDLVVAAAFPETPVLAGRTSKRFLQRERLLPLAEKDDAVVVAMADPLNREAMRAIEVMAGKPVTPCVAIPGEIDAAIERLYGGDDGGAARPTGVAAVGRDAERLRDRANEAPVIRLVDRMLDRAVEARASDIHIEPSDAGPRLRYRIDGVLRTQDAPPADLQAAIVSRIKIMSMLNYAERRRPQDGRARVVVRGREYDLRISTMPGIHGEGVVIRILDGGGVDLDFDAMGFEPAWRETYLDLLRRPNGIILVTGPTGSGKTTTLYASLQRLNAPERKIVTVEDPVEYQLDGITQVQVDRAVDLDFAAALRAYLRHDPDIVMVGEIRDLETAQIAAQSALTGHLVLSTVHTNSAAATVTRLTDMGLADYLLTATLNGIVSQRLVRRLCPHCREEYAAGAELVGQLDLPVDATLCHPTGCDRCDGTGYRGRIAIGEVLPVDEAIRQLIMRRAPATEIEAAAVAAGMTTIRRDGLAKALAGTTSLDEVLRVTLG